VRELYVEGMLRMCSPPPRPIAIGDDDR
jgi:hypothetical protein